MEACSIADLSGRTALVTGGASGIGLATARLLASAGASVAIADLNAGAVEGFTVRRVDVTDEDSVVSMIESVSAAIGWPDIVVCSAGTAIRDAATELPLADWRRVLDVNATGSFLVARSAARRMGPGGTIVLVGSIMGLSGGGIYPNISYQASKGAIVNMTRALAVEWAARGIRVNSVAPTYVRTPFIAPLLADADIMARIAAMTPMGRLAEPEEVAAAILFLAGPGAAMVTGHTLPVDGGFLAQ